MSVYTGFSSRRSFASALGNLGDPFVERYKQNTTGKVSDGILKRVSMGILIMECATWQKQACKTCDKQYNIYSCH